MIASRRRTAAVVTVLLILGLAAVAGVLFAAQGGFAPYRVPRGGASSPPSTDAATLARGEYLSRIGDCIACHTIRGGVAFAGGRAFNTNYGTLYSANITPDREHGIGDWSVDEFKHVMRNGVSRRGPLYPAFPYAQFASLTDPDLEAIYAYLRALPPSATSPPSNRLRFPESWRPVMIGWRMLFYRPSFSTSASASADRGQYLVDGPGHCAMCHGERGRAASLPAGGYLAGGSILGSGWYAPPLNATSLSRFSSSELADYLRTGISKHGSAYGPMADVIYRSLHGLTAEDATSIAEYLKGLPPHAGRRGTSRKVTFAQTADSSGSTGDQIYKKVCSDCHGDDGEGKEDHYPPLNDSVAVTAPDAVNAVRMVLYGGMAPTTPGNPRPYSMPPFAQQLSNADVAAVVNYIRRNSTTPSRLTAFDIEAMHGIVLE